MPHRQPPGEPGDRLRATAREVFGWTDLRPGQLPAMEAVLAGRDTLVVMPTGAGKSAVYQVPALLVPGPTVVVSPLISLQRDQVAGLLGRGSPDALAVAVNSAQNARETEAAWRAVRHGDAEFLFLAPEQLARDDVVERLARLGPRLLVVDEAQCVSTWGHDFRPEYRRVGAAVERLGHPVVLALTATAAPPVRHDIAASLGMRDPLQVVAGFDRPNLFLEVRRFLDDADKRRAVVESAAAGPKPGLVYAATRRDTEAYAAELTGLGLSAAAYHAGLRAAERRRVHDAFLGGGLDVVAATSAFGMGIDKPDVRFVLHASVPGSLDEYYQEIGRAGRDGRPAAAVLMYRTEDLGLRRFFASVTPYPEVLAEVARRVRAAGGPVPLARLREGAGVGPGRLTAAVNLLEQAGELETGRGGGVRAVGAHGPEEAAALAAAVAEDRRRLERSRVEMVRGYAETTGCRRRFLLGYFGEAAPGRCTACDTCAASGSASAAASGPAGEAPAAAPAAPFPPGARVVHRAWGPGAVMRTEEDRLTVLFETAGYRTLSLAAVAEHGLLRPEDADP
ncbi:ATP-dependent DNA helicase [Streptacidiphilus sp. ASG 303]|uniref:RecQ family ATP-dependent DNA helicase n=1 Tax=Streptacidiphilus sp. ASG 303 TaxID=2896847 RepID=UPI001E4ECCF0|nr:ATP-dependent DNA helicase RecQ [Streptacidiphilus sp. ASG 303]MCD0481281.1 ATP-dependent DNA helicase [Streptacidiphilus sp. ASG 303]